MVARERWEHYDRLYGHHYYGPAWPGFYRGRWNGGGFGPCYTQTPIGYMWNCGHIAHGRQRRGAGHALPLFRYRMNRSAQTTNAVNWSG